VKVVVIVAVRAVIVIIVVKIVVIDFVKIVEINAVVAVVAMVKEMATITAMSNYRVAFMDFNLRSHEDSSVNGPEVRVSRRFV
jgi:hypothetical protein